MDGGEGDDTVLVGSVEGPLEITLGEGADTLPVPQSTNGVGGLSEDHRITDFNLPEDRVEFRTDSFPTGVTITGVDVSAEAIEGEDASLVTFDVTSDGARSGTDMHTAISEGLSPEDADDIAVGILPPFETPPDTGEVIAPTLDGTDLVFEITTGDFSLPDPNTNLSNTDARPGGEVNPLSGIERVVLNLDDDIEGDIYAEVVTQYRSSDDAGTEVTISRYLNIVQGPGDLKGPGITADQRAGDDSLYLTRGPQVGTTEFRAYLNPFKLVGRLYLGAEYDDFFDPDESYSSVNQVEVIINRL